MSVSELKTEEIIQYTEEKKRTTFKESFSSKMKEFRQKSFIFRLNEMKVLKEAYNLNKIIEDQEDYIETVERILDIKKIEISKLESELITVKILPEKLTNIKEHPFWKKLKCYRFYLSSPHDLSDKPDEQFTELVMLSLREIEKPTEMNIMELTLPDGAEVKGKTTFRALLRIGNLPNNVPLVFSVFSLKDLQEGFLDFVIDANKVKTLHEEVLVRMFQTQQFEHQTSKDRIDDANAFKDMAMSKSVRLRKVINTEMEKLDTKTESNIDKFSTRLKLWQLVALGSGWGLFIITLAVLIGVVV